MTDHISSLKEALEKYEAWLAAGLPIDGGPYDTYPDDLYQAATRPEAIRSLLAALDEAQQDAKRYRAARQLGKALKVYDYDDEDDPTSGDWCYNPSPEQIDRIVDAAIAAQEGGKDA